MAKRVAVLAKLLAELLATYGGTQKDFADAIGITRPHLSHLLSGAPQYATISVELCLTIAEVGKTSASRVLRAANKADIAELIERLYGGPALVRTSDPSVSEADRRLLAKLKSLDRKTYRAIVTLIESWAVTAR